MDAVTYPDPKTQYVLAEYTVPLKLEIAEHDVVAKNMGMTWTPGLVWLNAKGAIAHSNVGFFPVSEFLAECLFGCGQVAASNSDWDQAFSYFVEVTEKLPESSAAPAAYYWSGVASKKSTGEIDGLMEAWNTLLDRHPDDAWATKVSFLRDS